MRKVNVGIIGLGRFGKNYLKTLSTIKNARVTAVCSRHEETLKGAGILKNKGIKATTDYRKILDDGQIDAIVIATPPKTHFTMAREAFLNGKHVLVEKPVTLTSAGCRELIKISGRRRRIFMAGHLHRYNPGIQQIKKDIDDGKLGSVNFAHCLHLGNGSIRNDVSALWDFLPHSLSIFNYLFGRVPISVNATGSSSARSNNEDAVSVSLNYGKSKYASAFASWLYPFKQMKISISGDKSYAIFDDYRKKDKLRYYRKTAHSGKPASENYGYISPKISPEKPLTSQLNHFIRCILENKRPFTDGNEALRVISTLECAQRSMGNGGKAIKIKSA